jgi:hypothetical protein
MLARLLAFALLLFVSIPGTTAVMLRWYGGLIAASVQRDLAGAVQQLAALARHRPVARPLVTPK